MLKSYGFLKRKQGLTREQFLEHWEKIHAPLFVAANMPAVKKYIQNHPVKGAGPEFETDIDGIAEIWFDNVESAKSFHRWIHSPDYKELREDGELYVDFGAVGNIFLGEPHVFKE